jgi:hypothetical protein
MSYRNEEGREAEKRRRGILELVVVIVVVQVFVFPLQ